MTSTQTNIFICAGEASGDMLGALLAQDLLAKQPNLILRGMGSHKMQAAGVDLVFHCDEIAVLGLWEVFTQFSNIRRAYHCVKREITEKKPNLVILIDYPGFNLRMAKIAKAAGCKVMYYVSPKIWAWKKGRLHKIKRYVDHMATLFAFEEKIYRDAGVPATFVGHPLVDKVQVQESSAYWRQQWHIEPNARVITLLPGSRATEIKNLTPTLAACLLRLKKKYPDLVFILPLAPTVKRAQLPQTLQAACHIVTELYPALLMSHAAIVASGTVTLEVALMQVPMAIIYRVNWLTYLIGRCLVHLTHIGLCNIITGREVAPEFLQQRMTVTAICAYIEKLLDDSSFHAQTREALAAVRQALCKTVTTSSAADVAFRVLEPHE